MKKMLIILFSIVSLFLTGCSAFYQPIEEDFEFGVSVNSTQIQSGGELVVNAFLKNNSGVTYKISHSGGEKKCTLINIAVLEKEDNRPIFILTVKVTGHKFNKDEIISNSKAITLSAGSYKIIAYAYFSIKEKSYFYQNEVMFIDVI